MSTQYKIGLGRCYTGSSFVTLKRISERAELKVTPPDCGLECYNCSDCLQKHSAVLCEIWWSLLTREMLDQSMRWANPYFSSQHKHWLPLPEFLLAKKKPKPHTKKQLKWKWNSQETDLKGIDLFKKKNVLFFSMARHFVISENNTSQPHYSGHTLYYPAVFCH